MVYVKLSIGENIKPTHDLYVPLY